MNSNTSGALAGFLPEARHMRAYVAGPMTGHKDFNFPAFNAAADALRAAGWHVENPADHGVVGGAQWADYMHLDIACLATCSTIHLLPGWSKSKGAALEVFIAQALGMEFQYADGAELPDGSHALGLAAEFDLYAPFDPGNWPCHAAAAELRRLHALSVIAAPAPQQPAFYVHNTVVRVLSDNRVSGHSAMLTKEAGEGMLAFYSAASAQGLPGATASTIDALMEQAQVYASAWSSVGGPFDSGQMLENSNAAKAELLAMLQSAAGLVKAG